MQQSMEATLEAIEQAAAGARRTAIAAAAALKRAESAARSGQLRELDRALVAAGTASEQLATAVQAAKDADDLDEAEHLSSGAYERELLAAAADRGVAMYAEDDRLLCYPSLLRVLPGDAALEIDRRRERRLRPSVVVSMLEAAQTGPPRFRAEPFLESLAGAYALLARAEATPDPVLRLDAVWGVLTLLPGQAREYTRPEFARDLYLLDQSGVRTTRAGRGLRWHASSGTRGAGVLTTVARSGQQQRYWGLSLTENVDAENVGGVR